MGYGVQFLTNFYLDPQILLRALCRTQSAEHYTIHKKKLVFISILRSRRKPGLYRSWQLDLEALQNPEEIKKSTPGLLPPVHVDTQSLFVASLAASEGTFDMPYSLVGGRNHLLRAGRNCFFEIWTTKDPWTSGDVTVEWCPITTRVVRQMQYCKVGDPTSLTHYDIDVNSAIPALTSVALGWALFLCFQLIQPGFTILDRHE